MIRSPKPGDRVTVPGTPVRPHGAVVEISTWPGSRRPRIVVRLDGKEQLYQYSPGELQREE